MQYPVIKKNDASVLLAIKYVLDAFFHNKYVAMKEQNIAPKKNRSVKENKAVILSNKVIVSIH